LVSGKVLNLYSGVVLLETRTKHLQSWPSSPPGNCRDIPSIRPRGLRPKYYPIHNSTFQRYIAQLPTAL
jgi:hypothetical protein